MWIMRAGPLLVAGIAGAAVVGLGVAGLTVVDASTAAASDARDPRVLERVSTFTTYFTPGEERNRNIVLVARKVDGVTVGPGETFSLNGYTGPRGHAEGYVDAPVILGGRLVNAVGGGISQFAATLFNAAYYAGLEDVFHKPHSYFISRYPAVIESTIFYPTLDLKIRNDTAHPILIDSSTTGDSVTVTLWGTKQVEVSTKWGPRRDVTHPRTVRSDRPDCIPTDGTDGFAQDAWRIMTKKGTEVKRERFSWRYRAEPRFVCTGR
jgi:vancomycin resistance protein YoaR